MELLDYISGIYDFYIFLKQRCSSLLTINNDPLNISKNIIKFNGSRDFWGYTIISSTNERNRRIVHWFYRNIKAPTLNNWEDCIYLFNLYEIPTHILQLYDFNKNPLNKFIIIHSINKEFINYTYEDNENNEVSTINIPIGFASLVPERFLSNLKMYYNT